MGPTIWNCSDTLSGIGDNTGGPIWRAGLEPEQPLLGGFQKATNFPTGESLYSPVGFVALEQTILIRAADKIVGPVCAYNVMNMIGYLSTAIVMCAFVYYLLKSRWIAWLAGYAVAFTPYAQSKVGGHPSYGYASLLIGTFWLTLHIIKRQRWRHGLGLAAILGACAYFDPYFILLSGTVLVPTLATWLIYAIKTVRQKPKYKAEFIKTFKVFVLAFLGLLVLAAPLAVVRIREAELITSSTGAVRGNIEAAAMQCSNFPQDYLLPDPYNQPLTKLLGPGYSAKNIESRHWCGPGESRVAISLVLISVASLFLIVLLWEKLNSRRTKLSKLLNYNVEIVIGSILLVALAAFLLGLPPRIGGFLMPSGLVIKITETWRIFAREYLVLNMMLVVLCSIGLKYFYETFKNKAAFLMKCLFVVLAVIMMLEYKISDNFSPFTFSYNRDVPKIYHQVRDNPDIKAIAEYPIDRSGIEADSIVYYVTMQSVHKKSILNSSAISNTNEKLHISIKDLTDPQTLPVLRAMGLEYVVIHGLTASQVKEKTDQLEILKEETPLVYGLTIIRSAPTNTMVLARIIDGPTKQYAVTIQKGFTVNNDIMKSSVDQEYETAPDSELSVVTAPSNKLDKNQPVDACFDLKMAGVGDTSLVDVTVNGISQLKFNANDQYYRVSVKAKPGDKIKIHNQQMHNTRINNLGC